MGNIQKSIHVDKITWLNFHLLAIKSGSNVSKEIQKLMKKEVEKNELLQGED
jgi:hypothetical protein